VLGVQIMTLSCPQLRNRVVKVSIVGTLLLSFLPVASGAGQQPQDSDRPTLPRQMAGLHREELDAYESKGEPVARLSEALIALNLRAWDLIHKYLPTIGKPVEGLPKKAHPEDPDDSRFVAYSANDDPTASPMPLLCMIWSLPGTELSGGLKGLHDELAAAMTLPDYSTWTLDELRKAGKDLTEPARTGRGVKYLAPKKRLSFRQALQLYAMTIALVGRETKWTGKTGSPAPDMVDFSNRFRHELPRQVPNGGTATLLIYLPGVMGHPRSKDEFQERADVVVMKRKGTTFEVEQFPVYLTVDQKAWDPAWIGPKDELADASLNARKFKYNWTRLDGPYLWYRPEQLNGAPVYRAKVQFRSSEIVIEAERYIERRGAIKIAERPSDYDPQKMTPFTPGVDPPFTASTPSPLTQQTESAGSRTESPATPTPVSKPVAEARAVAPPPARTPAPPAPAVPIVHVPATKIAAIFRRDTNLVLAGTTPTSDDQAKIATAVIDNWLAPYLLNATGPEADTLRMAVPNSNGTLSLYFSVSPAPKNPKDPPNIITSRTQSSLSVALPQEHYEVPGNVLLDLVGVFTSNLPSQDKQSGEVVKKSFGKFLAASSANGNPNQPVPPDALAKLGVEPASSGKFITADIPEHPTGALGIYTSEEQGMAYHIVDFFNLLLKEVDYLRRTGRAREFETDQKLLATLPTGLVVHFSIQKEVDAGTKRKRKEQPLPENSATDIYISLPKHAYGPAKDDYQILRAAVAEALAKSQPSGGPTGAEISSVLDDFLRSYSNDPHNQNNILTEVIKSLYATSSLESGQSAGSSNGVVVSNLP